MAGALTKCTQYGTLSMEVRKMIKNISVRKLRENLAEVLDDVKMHLDRYIVSKRGEPEAVLMCIDDYEGWLETLEIMSRKDAMDDINKAKKELAAGKFHTFQEVFGRKQKKLKNRRK